MFLFGDPMVIPSLLLREKNILILVLTLYWSKMLLQIWWDWLVRILSNCIPTVNKHCLPFPKPFFPFSLSLSVCIHPVSTLLMQFFHMVKILWGKTIEEKLITMINAQLSQFLLIKIELINGWILKTRILVKLVNVESLPHEFC